MNVASLDFCRELYALSGWGDLWQWWYINPDGSEAVVNEYMDGKLCPAYDLGYLLRRLEEVRRGLGVQHNYTEMNWTAYFAGREDRPMDSATDNFGDTPEDAAAKLAIELFKQGILTKVGDDL